jgi:hypothetical protein
MDRSIAERMIQSGDEATIRLNEALVMGQGALPGEEFEAMRLAVGTILVSIQMDVLRSVYTRYPDLDRFGYFRRGDGAPSASADE